MFDPKIFDDLAKKLSEAVPSSLRTVKEELEKNFRAILHSSFSKLDLVSRDEFDIQVGVLAKTREKLEALEAKVAALEPHTGGAKTHKPTTKDAGQSNASK